MKNYITGLMRDKRNNLFDRLVKAVLLIISVFYAAVINTWNFFYGKGLLKSRRANAKIVSVGNIAVGGTGKTPFVIFLAKLLKAQGKKPVVLIRGYGNDEWLMIEEKLKGIPVIKGRDRVRLSKEAIEKYSPDVLILDDGFQHRRLKRDLDIILIDSNEAFGNEFLLPRGILREPLNSIKRADMAVLTKADFGKDNIRNLRIALSGDHKIKDILEAVYAPLDFVRLNNDDAQDLTVVKGKKICSISAIANPDYFKYMLKNLGATVMKSMDYPDHYGYRQKDLDNIVNEAKRENCDFIVTTEKDAVKLRDMRHAGCDIQILALRTELKVTKGMEKLNDRLNSGYAS